MEEILRLIEAQNKILEQNRKMEAEREAEQQRLIQTLIDQIQTATQRLDAANAELTLAREANMQQTARLEEQIERLTRNTEAQVILYQRSLTRT